MLIYAIWEMDVGNAVLESLSSCNRCSFILRNIRIITVWSEVLILADMKICLDCTSQNQSSFKCARTNEAFVIVWSRRLTSDFTQSFLVDLYTITIQPLGLADLRQSTKNWTNYILASQNETLDFLFSKQEESKA